MPVYEYACKSCGEHLEIAQSFKDDPLTTCPACGGPLRKVFGSIGIAFKGSGFYRTDSRSASNGAKTDGADKAEKTAAEKTDRAGGDDKASGTDKASGSDTSKGSTSPSKGSGKPSKGSGGASERSSSARAGASTPQADSRAASA